VANGSSGNSIQVVHEDTAGISYAVNQHWIADYAELHRGLVELCQLLYDIAPLVLLGKMSTTVYMNEIYKDILVMDQYSNRSLSINSTIHNLYSGRHKLILDKPTIGEKRNWVKKQACSLRNEHPGLLRCTTAKQIEDVAQSMMRALRLGTTTARYAALKSIPDSILVDTRGKLGRTRTWYGFPVDPPQGSKAYFRRVNGSWVLWVAKPTRNRTQLSAQNPTTGQLP